MNTDLWLEMEVVLPNMWHLHLCMRVVKDN